ncbi:MAG: cell envelope biogenesis protein OmpA [Flavobacteriaceae bacterium]|nr:cell envelope biogenesis protein OmpA [Flavobacteriaceae bacterium]|tara:strand:+ start:4212 stop:5171 length:960 start_codon:yes stop_codon:yes gene_type:complete
MPKKIIVLGLIVLNITACVSSKSFNDLDVKYRQLKSDYDALALNNTNEIGEKNELQDQLNALQATYDITLSERIQLEKDLEMLQKNYNQLNTAYTALEQNSSKVLEENAKKNRALLEALALKEEALALENERLMRLQADMQERSDRIAELEELIAAKDQAMKDLKNSISKALTAFEGKGLTVEQRNGKVYVSMENKLLFKSGSWSVGNQGRNAIEQLGSVLAENPDIAVLIEGHTDNVPFSNGGKIANNWDLSTKRATAIISILSENKAISLNNLTAAGRSEYAPVESNDTAIGKAKNRRIEVVLTPKLDEISKLLNGN